MKKIIFGASILLTVFAACNNGNTGNTTDKTSIKDTAAAPANKNTSGTETPVKGIVDGYLHLKNALVSDNGKDAASAGNEILAAMSKIDTSKMSTEQKKAYASVADDIKEHAGHINAHADKISHQREHFEMLSRDVYDLVKVFGAGQSLYKDFCPMANDQKGAFWLSETKEIKNPYFGSEMSECGEVKEELK